jgi:hypothetical protein
MGDEPFSTTMQLSLYNLLYSIDHFILNDGRKRYKLHKSYERLSSGTNYRSTQIQLLTLCNRYQLLAWLYQI